MPRLKCDICKEKKDATILVEDKESSVRYCIDHYREEFRNKNE